MFFDLILLEPDAMLDDPSFLVLLFGVQIKFNNECPYSLGDPPAGELILEAGWE